MYKSNKQFNKADKATLLLSGDPTGIFAFHYVKASDHTFTPTYVSWQLQTKHCCAVNTTLPTNRTPLPPNTGKAKKWA